MKKIYIQPQLDTTVVVFENLMQGFPVPVSGSASPTEAESKEMNFFDESEDYEGDFFID